MPFAPSGFSGVGVSIGTRSKTGELGRGGQRVLGERARERVAVLVVAELLVQRERDARRHSPMHLAVHDQCVHDAARVVHANVTQWRHEPGLGVDLDDADVRAERERGRDGLHVYLGAQYGARLTCRTRHVGPAD